MGFSLMLPLRAAQGVLSLVVLGLSGYGTVPLPIASWSHEKFCVTGFVGEWETASTTAASLLGLACSQEYDF
jgi:hypothetical protein